MSTTTRARLDPRITACPCRIIMSSVTGTVVSRPCITMPSESPTRIRSQWASSSRAVCAWYDVSETIGSPPLRERMSGAVSRLISFWIDMSKNLIRRPAENRYPDDEGMEDQTERKIEQRADDDRDDVVAAPADRERRRAGIGAALERDPVIDRPGEDRAEQHDRTEIAVRNEMRDRPGLHPDQHGVLERAPDLAPAIGRDHADAGRPHQQLGDVVRPSWRRPDLDPAGGPIMPEAVADQNQSRERDDRHQPLVGPLADAGDHGGTRSAQGHEDMRAEKQHQSDHQYAHVPSEGVLRAVPRSGTSLSGGSRGHGTSGGKQSPGGRGLSCRRKEGIPYSPHRQRIRRR